MSGNLVPVSQNDDQNKSQLSRALLIQNSMPKAPRVLKEKETKTIIRDHKIRQLVRSCLRAVSGCEISPELITVCRFQAAAHPNSRKASQIHQALLHGDKKAHHLATKVNVLLAAIYSRCWYGRIFLIKNFLSLVAGLEMEASK